MIDFFSNYDRLVVRKKCCSDDTRTRLSDYSFGTRFLVMLMVEVSSFLITFPCFLKERPITFSRLLIGLSKLTSMGECLISTGIRSSLAAFLTSS